MLPSQGFQDLYDRINSIFKSSTFGVVDSEGQEFESTEVGQGLERILQRQLRSSRKGVDKWPMFMLTITYSEITHVLPSKLASSNQLLEKAVDVLEALVHNWLRAHHFQPKHRRVECDESDNISPSKRPLHGSKDYPDRKSTRLNSSHGYIG